MTAIVFLLSACTSSKEEREKLKDPTDSMINIVTGGSNIKTNQDSWSGSFVDEIGRALTVTEAKPNIQFSLSLANENCQEVVEGAATITDPTVAEYKDEMGCKITLILVSDGIKITESNCTHGARCGNTEGNYKRK